ncbi:outer membrane lipoprotein carrier protein LolA [Sandaracinobacter neustonicus]|uniref:Outer membrane lipoprotein carrier protein LolA n=1 Tax=Sandaracinobacter neustonicus TaxID=1715348 RepID=A0A501XTA1_9SPHN|nr:outer membrane lipoprotein carrier protein LolA [Sandaracinobacter neustonicus]TPE63766.1 outer membrane lipoprotein carrier protein LolA [Sandaracinobacter neustonicus]
MRYVAPLAVIALIAAPAAGAPSLADVQKALAATQTVSADFVQTATDGRQARGTMLLKRPGRVRFDYGPEASYLVVADGSRLSFVDYKVRQVSQWPVRQTPLGVLLDPNADLAKVAKIVPAADNPMPGTVGVLAQDAKRPDIGRILFFLAPDSAAPGGLRLTGWRVTDAQGNLTTVELRNMRFNAPIADSNFSFRDPRPVTKPPGRAG